MTDEDPQKFVQQTAKEILGYAHTAFKALRAQVGFISDNANATSALLRVFFEKFPELADRYEQTYASAKTDSPMSSSTRQLADQFDVIIRRLESLIEKLEKSGGALS